MRNRPVEGQHLRNSPEITKNRSASMCSPRSPRPFERSLESFSSKTFKGQGRGKHVETILLSKLCEFRQWYLIKRNREPKDKKKVGQNFSGIFEKRFCTPYRSLKLILDEFIKNTDHSKRIPWLPQRPNSEPWLDFYIENFKSHSHKDIEEILSNAMKIASTFLVDSSNSKLQLKDIWWQN